jgi:hypothetical protein
MFIFNAFDIFEQWREGILKSLEYKNNNENEWENIIIWGCGCLLLIGLSWISVFFCIIYAGSSVLAGKDLFLYML